jgi:hypothetical protein
MRLRLVVVMRATAFTLHLHAGLRLPARSSASAWNLSFLSVETQPSVLRPAMTEAGHSVCVLRIVCTSPFGSE